MKLKIENGQFRDEQGQVVKPEFGNREQIQALRQEVERQELLKNAKPIPSPTCWEYRDEWNVEVQMKCNCGNEIHHNIICHYQEQPTKTQMIDFMEGELLRCRKCYTEYEIFIDKGELKSICL